MQKKKPNKSKYSALRISILASIGICGGIMYWLLSVYLPTQFPPDNTVSDWTATYADSDNLIITSNNASYESKSVTSVTIWDTATSTPISELLQYDDKPRTVSFNSENQLFFIVGEFSIRVYSIEQWQRLYHLQHARPICAFETAHTVTYVGKCDNNFFEGLYIEVVDTSSMRESSWDTIQRIEITSNYETVSHMLIDEHRNGEKFYIMLSDGHLSSIEVRDTTSYAVEYTLAIESAIMDMSWFDNHLLLIANGSHILNIYDTQRDQQIDMIEFTHPVYDFDISADETLLVVADDRYITYFDLVEMETIGVFDIGFISTIELNEEGTTALVGTIGNNQPYFEIELE